MCWTSVGEVTDEFFRKKTRDWDVLDKCWKSVGEVTDELLRRKKVIGMC
jgi:hypothetical protein